MPVSNPNIKDNSIDASWDLEVTNALNKLESIVSNLETRVASSSTVLPPAVPSNTIVMWYGATADIPDGWYLCDGSNSTPDLRNKFIVGAGSSYALNNTGGFTDPVLLEHSHTFSFSGTTGTGGGSHSHSITDPGHSHRTAGPQGDFNDNFNPLPFSNTSYAGDNIALTPEIYDNGEAFTSIGVNNTNIDHNHSFSLSGTTANAGTTSTSGKNLPPYYALYYIMKG